MTDHHPYHFHSDSRLRLRLWTGGHLRDEVWIDAADMDTAGGLAQRCGAYHAQLAQLADAAGIPWLVEVYDPERAEAEAYVRYGTDTAGMVAPAPITGWAG